MMCILSIDSISLRLALPTTANPTETVSLATNPYALELTHLSAAKNHKISHLFLETSTYSGMVFCHFVRPSLSHSYFH